VLDPNEAYELQSLQLITTAESTDKSLAPVES
jgi:hypothetical protein